MVRPADAYVATHPLRFKLLQLLAEKPRTAEQLAAELNISSHLVYFHLTTLKQHELIQDSYTLGNPPEDPRAVLQFSLADDGKQLVDKLEVALA